jgi:Lrp/AsnC family leucine-responsive transcriptional regulator
MSNYEIDDIDQKILHCLLEDSLRSYKEIGQLVHLTGQAVGARVRKLEEQGVIEGYTLRWNPGKAGKTVQAFITVFLSSNTAHSSFVTYVQSKAEIAELHRVSGEGCYWMRVLLPSTEALNVLLDELLKYGNYKLSHSIGHIK